MLHEITDLISELEYADTLLDAFCDLLEGDGLILDIADKIGELICTGTCLLGAGCVLFSDRRKVLDHIND